MRVLKWKNAASFYASPDWIRLRSYFLTVNPFCSRCLNEGKHIPAEEVHHRIPVEENPNLALDIDNLEGLCKTHHSSHTAKERIEKSKRGRIANLKWKV